MLEPKNCSWNSQTKQWENHTKTFTNLTVLVPGTGLMTPNLPFLQFPQTGKRLKQQKTLGRNMEVEDRSEMLMILCLLWISYEDQTENTRKIIAKLEAGHFWPLKMSEVVEDHWNEIHLRELKASKLLIFFEGYLFGWKILPDCLLVDSQTGSVVVHEDWIFHLLKKDWRNTSQKPDGSRRHSVTTPKIQWQGLRIKWTKQENMGVPCAIRKLTIYKEYEETARLPRVARWLWF